MESFFKLEQVLFMKTRLSENTQEYDFHMSIDIADYLLHCIHSTKSLKIHFWTEN